MTASGPLLRLAVVHGARADLGRPRSRHAPTCSRSRCVAYEVAHRPAALRGRQHHRDHLPRRQRGRAAARGSGTSTCPRATTTSSGARSPRTPATASPTRRRWSPRSSAASSRASTATLAALDGDAEPRRERGPLRAPPDHAPPSLRRSWARWRRRTCASARGSAARRARSRAPLGGLDGAGRWRRAWPRPRVAHLPAPLAGAGGRAPAAARPGRAACASRRDPPGAAVWIDGREVGAVARRAGPSAPACTRCGCAGRATRPPT